jgi:hypothetical protein
LGLGFGLWKRLGRGHPPASPFRSCCLGLGARVEVDRAQPQAEAADEKWGWPACQWVKRAASHLPVGPRAACPSFPLGGEP